MLFDMHEISAEIHSEPIVFETGRMAKQANGSVLVTQGGTAVLVALGCGLCQHVCPRGVLRLENHKKGENPMI